MIVRTKDGTVWDVRENGIAAGKHRIWELAAYDIPVKVSVHDDVGRTLLAARSYMEQPKHERNREKLLSLWRYNLAVMRNDIEPQQQSNEWKLLLDAAEAVDVEIVLNGELPE